MAERADEDVRIPDFEAVYAENSDPWSVADSFYEQRKLGLVLGALGRPRYQLAWDPGCGTGHLAARLADRCERVVASDASAAAVRIATDTCRELTGVSVLHSPAQCDPGELVRGVDLVVISEFLYYLSPAERRATLALVARLSAPDAEVLAVHWRHHPHDAYLSGADTQTEIVETLSADGWVPSVHLDDPDFVLDSIRRTR